MRPPGPLIAVKGMIAEGVVTASNRLVVWVKNLYDCHHEYDGELSAYF